MFLEERLEQAYAKGDKALLREVSDILLENREGDTETYLNHVKRVDYAYQLFCKKHDRLHPEYPRRIFLEVCIQFFQEMEASYIAKKMGWEETYKEIKASMS